MLAHLLFCLAAVIDQNLEEINVLRITLDTQIEDLEQHFETAHINYLQVKLTARGGCFTKGRVHLV